MKQLSAWITFDYFQAMLPAKYEGKAREEKATKITANLFKMLFFGTLQVYAFFCVMPDLPFNPPELGGNKKWEFFFKGFPYPEITPAMKRFYMIDLAYHMESWLHLVLSKPRNDFAEMFLHHLATAILIMSSYMTNTIGQGVSCMFLNDHADFWIGMIRVVMDVSGPVTIGLVAFGFGSTFVYTRMFVFPFYMIKFAGWDQWVLFDGQGFFNTKMTPFLMVLQVLNIYWCFLIFKMFARFASKGEAIDMHSKDTIKKPARKT